MNRAGWSVATLGGGKATLCMVAGCDRPLTSTDSLPRAAGRPSRPVPRQCARWPRQASLELLEPLRASKRAEGSQVPAASVAWAARLGPQPDCARVRCSKLPVNIQGGFVATLSSVTVRRNLRIREAIERVALWLFSQTK